MAITPNHSQPFQSTTSRLLATLLMSGICCLNARLQFQAHDFHAAGTWACLSLAVAVLSLASCCGFPKLTYLAAGAVAAGILLLGQ